MADIEQGRVIAGKYRLVRRLSGGGMGSVWLGHHEQLDAPVAIKFMHGSLLDVAGARQRFEREAKAAAQIRSPYVVHVYDHGIDQEVPFIVMEYLEGEDLGRRLKRVRPLPREEAVRICEQVCKGLHRAHKLGIVHRDLKPGNIFLSSEDEDMVKILDFGIAKETGNRRVVQGETTTTGQVLGSPHYMSPEQARGQPLDGRSDLWSLAVILFRALTGKRPFDGHDIGDLIVRICTDPVPPASSIRPELGPTVDKFFERAFERDPNGRFQTARAFAAALRAAVLGGSSIRSGAERLPDLHASAPGVESWDSPESGSFSSSIQPEIDDDALTQLTPPRSGARSLPDDDPRTPVDASRTLTALGRPRRRGMLVAAAVAVTVGGLAALALLRGDRSMGASPEPSTHQEEPAAEPAASAEAASAASSQAPAGENASAAAAASMAPEPSAAATNAAAPSPRPVPVPRPAPAPRPRRPTPPPPPPPPPPQSLPDLGY